MLCNEVDSNSLATFGCKIMQEETCMMMEYGKERGMDTNGSCKVTLTRSSSIELYLDVLGGQCQALNRG